MIRRSPAEYYIKYLMLLPEGLSDDDIVRTLRECQLDYPGSAYFRRLRLSMHPPTPFYPLLETDLASYQFLQQQKVHRLFFRDEHVNTALQVLKHPRAKEIIESMLLIGEVTFTILSRMKGFGFRITTKAIEYYKHFFLNTDLVDPTEMRALVTVRVEDMALEDDSKESLIRYKAMKQAMYNDPRYMVVNSPSPLLASMRLQMRHGLLPNRIDYGRLAETVRTSAITASAEASMRSGPKDAQNSRDFSVVAANMDAILRERGNGDDTLRKSMLALGTDNQEIPSIQQLTQGNFTDCVDPIVEEKAHGKER